MPDDFEAVFQALKQIMVNNSEGYTVLSDQPGRYYLQSTTPYKGKQPLSFGGVEIKKNYVSYHLVPVYCNPELMAQTSEALKKRMQGKGCFNFKTVDTELFQELADLTLTCRKALGTTDLSK